MREKCTIYIGRLENSLNFEASYTIMIVTILSKIISRRLKI